MYELENACKVPFNFARNMTSISEGHSKVKYDLNGFSHISDCDGQERFDCYRLRKEIYVDECKWSDDYKNIGIEIDQFDAFSSIVAVKNLAGDVIATLRSTSSVFDWMAIDCYDGNFKNSSEDLKITGINEISRLCIKKSHRNFMIIPNVSVLDFLLAGMIYQNKAKNIRGSVIVTHTSMYAVLKKKGLNITMLTKPKQMPDGCKISVFFVDVNASLISFKPIQYINKYIAV